MKIAVTGHRPSKLGHEYAMIGPYSDYLRSQLRNCIEINTPTQLISGMALGVDTIFSLLGIELNIPIIAAIPFNGQEAIWPIKAKKIYKEILANQLVTTRIICGGGYSAKKMQLRNIWMVDTCDTLVACWNGTTGGTANCIKYAKEKNRNIIYIDPEGWKNV